MAALLHPIKMDFGLSLEEATHSAGDKFEREIDAVIAFGLMFHQRSLNEEQEYGASINKITEGRTSYFIFTNLTNSAETFDKELADLTRSERNRVRAIVDDDSVARIHTHWLPNNPAGLDFSDTDIVVANGYDQITTIYLVNGEGDVMRRMKYINKNGNIITSNGIPVWSNGGSSANLFNLKK